MEIDLWLGELKTLNKRSRRWRYFKKNLNCFRDLIEGLDFENSRKFFLNILMVS